MRRHILRARTAAALGLLAVLFAAAPGQAQTPSWVALDTQPAGTPASVVFNADASSLSQSVLDVTIHGFWVVQKIGDDGRLYQSIEVPGLPNKVQYGAPNLPVCRFDLGLVNGADVASMQPPVVTASTALPGYLVWPAPIEAMLHDGSPEVFQRDEAIYSAPGFWPTSDGTSSVLHELLGFLPTSSCETYPFHWDPISGLLSVATSVRYRFVHNGPGTALPLTTPAQRRVVSQLLANWQTVGPSVSVDTNTYSGYYLIVCQQALQSTLQPLADQKSARGLKVAWRFVEDIGSVCMNIRSAVGAWYNTTPKGAEHYCLLVGDVAVLPICNGPQSNQVPFGDPSDDPYGTPFALNNDRQIMVGRLSPENSYDLAATVDMLLAYEDHPVMDDYYGNVLLVAHGGVIDPNDPIWPYQEKVRTAPYTNPPSFFTYYGNVQGNTNAGLKAGIENYPPGIVDYFGHGSTFSWSGWDVTSESFSSAQVGLMSLAPRNPIVWSIACQTGGIQAEDCLGESWMHRYGLGAVAFYGSTVNAKAYPSVDLNQNLFYAVYSQDIRIQGFTYYDAEYRMENVRKSGDSWKYLLLGDPEMTIRTTQPQSPWTVGAPWVEHSACGPGGCPEIRRYVTLAGGGPAVGVRVGIYQPPTPGGAGVADNRYTDATGLAAIPAPGLGDGLMYCTVMDDEGNCDPDTVSLQGGQVVGVGMPRAGGFLSLRAAPSVVHAGTVFTLGRPALGPARLDLYDPTGRRVRSLSVEPGALSVRWDAGDASGGRVPSGIYLASYRDSQGQARARVVVLR